MAGGKVFGWDKGKGSLFATAISLPFSFVNLPPHNNPISKVILLVDNATFSFGLLSCF